MNNRTICLLNDSFPPLIDGVSNTVVNYAQNIEKSGNHAIVVTPDHPQAEDEKFGYQVVRYPSMSVKMVDGYMAGFPFSPEAALALSDKEISLLHCHCPIMSACMSRELRQIKKAPIVLTYHTKFDIDIANITKNEPLQNLCKKFLAENISACDEVWAVSNGAGENLRSLGYEGEYIVMPNGVDMARGRASEEKTAEITAGYDLPEEVPVYLFVGRLMWYKGIGIILDALAQLKNCGRDFRMVFIGKGSDGDDIIKKAEDCGIADKCIFTGALSDREALKAWYSRADIFIFPSTFDTNGLVVREAAACELPCILIKDSCAAEGVADDINGFLIEENAQSLCSCLQKLYGRTQHIREVGKNACAQLYVSWSDSVENAMNRYEIVIDKYKRGEYPAHTKIADDFFARNGKLMEQLAKALSHRRNAEWPHFIG